MLAGLTALVEPARTKGRSWMKRMFRGEHACRMVEKTVTSNAVCASEIEWELAQPDLGISYQFSFQAPATDEELGEV